MGSSQKRRFGREVGFYCDCRCKKWEQCQIFRTRTKWQNSPNLKTRPVAVCQVAKLPPKRQLDCPQGQSKVPTDQNGLWATSSWGPKQVSKKVKTGAKRQSGRTTKQERQRRLQRRQGNWTRGFDKETARANTGQRGSNGNDNSPTGTGQERTTDKAAAATEAKRQTANGNGR